MSLSDKIKDIKFSKSVAGYSTKEVDGFLDEIVSAVMEQEKEISALCAKTEAYENRAKDIEKKEKAAADTLEDAKNEARRIIGEAEKKAEHIVAAGEGAADEKRAAAEKAAAEIITAADNKGKEILLAAKNEAERINETVAALVGEYEEFEAKFRTEVAKTVKNLADIRSSAPKTEKAEKTEKKPEEPVKAEPSVPDTQDFEFVGGRRVPSEATKEMPRRKLYDTLTVTYDNEDDFADIKEFLGKKEIKNPTDF
ncbi:MAG: DivIVA domain-containing protein [Clostridia bacterium]|nr:DivIVA domain-containing protein [Clostridia bacterium]